MASPVVRNFMKQQGFSEEPADACDMRFAGLGKSPGGELRSSAVDGVAVGVGDLFA